MRPVDADGGAIPGDGDAILKQRNPASVKEAGFLCAEITLLAANLHLQDKFAEVCQNVWLSDSSQADILGADPLQEDGVVLYQQHSGFVFKQEPLQLHAG